MSVVAKSFVVLTSALFLAACATHIKPSTSINPPPLAKFSAFDRFELKAIELSPEYAKDSANQRAFAKIQEYFDARVKPVVTEWNSKSPASVTTLVIEPRIEQLKFVSVGTRIFAGPFAGGSAVVMKVKYTDKTSGKLIAEPEFFQRAHAMSGATTFGGQDNAMLARISTLVADYNSRNYSQQVGGDTGAVPD